MTYETLLMLEVELAVLIRRIVRLGCLIVLLQSPNLRKEVKDAGSSLAVKIESLPQFGKELALRFGLIKNG
jgi:hypothetical protein